MESARRASIVHQKRTGRALRVTEADVINEEMYEEINDLPTEYRRLNAHLQTRSADFDQRLLAYLSCQIATRQAVSNCWQNEQSPFEIDGVRSRMSQGSLSAAPPPYLFAGNGNDYGPPLQPSHMQSMAQGEHIRSPSTATTGLSGFDQQRPQSSFSSPPVGGNLVSPTSDSTMQPPWPNSNLPTELPSSNNISRSDSAVDMAGNHQCNQHRILHNPDNVKSSPQSYRAQRGHLIDPLSTTLPPDGQQFFPSSPQAFDFHTGYPDATSPSWNFSNRRYSYNPNGEQKSASSSLLRTHSNHFVAPTTLGQACPSSSPLRSHTIHTPRFSTSCAGALPQAYHDAASQGSGGTFMKNTLQESRDTLVKGETIPRGSAYSKD
jgi:hypothetical protein